MLIEGRLGVFVEIIKPINKGDEIIALIDNDEHQKLYSKLYYIYNELY